MDITKMSFKPNEFDFIFDKGTLDCLTCSENANQSIEKYISSIKDLLKPKGVFFCVSHNGPATRLKYF